MDAASAVAGTFDFSQARRLMVDCQVRPNQVADPRLLEAMRRIPRERFLPSSLMNLAYVDDDVPLGHGRALMKPMVIARLVQLAEPVAEDKALVVGAGTGYSSALLAACGAAVTALEEDEALLGIARETLPVVAPAVRIAAGPLRDGLAQGSPWDIILIEGGVREIPATLSRQLKVEGGRLITVLAARRQTAVVAEWTPGGLSVRPVFDCTAPLLPSLLPESAFVF
jgi:protein-L-isoaspartate(D-aspartate) O-methyltransferase